MRRFRPHLLVLRRCRACDCLQALPGHSMFGRSVSLDSSMFGASREFATFPDEGLELADLAPCGISIFPSPSTRSPRRISGSMPSSPLGRFRALNPHRQSSLLHSFSSNSDYSASGLSENTMMAMEFAAQDGASLFPPLANASRFLREDGEFPEAPADGRRQAPMWASSVSATASFPNQGAANPAVSGHAI